MTPARLALALLAALTAAAPARSGTYVFVHDRGAAANQVHAFALEENGDLTPVDAPFASTDPVAAPDLCHGLCRTMAADAKSARLFTSGGSGVSVWSVGEDGALSLDPRSPFGATAPLFGVATARVGKRLFVYAAEYDLDQLRGFELQDDGALVELASSPFPAGDGPNGIAAAKRLVFAPSEDGFVTSYVVESDGALAPSGPPLELAPPSVSIFNATPDAKGKLLYVADDGFDDPVDGATDRPPSVYAFRVDRRTAALRPVAGSPFATSMPLEQVVFATGASTAKKLVVVVGFDAGAADLQVFRIGKKGVLAALGPLQDSGLGALAHALDPKGKWLLVASADEVRASGIDGRTGLVTPLGPGSRQPLGAGGAEPNAIVVLSR